MKTDYLTPVTGGQTALPVIIAYPDWRSMLVVLLSYGLGVDSSVILTRWLLDPTSRDFPLSALTVVTSMVGNEFPDSKELVEKHLLPLMREAGVRYVQLGKEGPTSKDWVVLSDSRETDTLYMEGGGFTLEDESFFTGTNPQYGGIRKCSLKFKGDVLDPWMEKDLGQTNFRHVMGFNADEPRRVLKDKSFSRASRLSEYPLVEWGWGREKCESYLEETFGEPWAKSCCYFCPFANNRDGIEAHMARLAKYPKLAAKGMLMERITEALNPRQFLFAKKGWGDDFQATVENYGQTEALKAFEQLLAETEWAVYRVRRLWAGKTSAQRSLVAEATGTRAEMEAKLAELAATLGVEVTEAQRTKVLYLADKPEEFPGVEELYAVCPAVPKDKQSKTFEEKWEAATPKRRLPLVA